MPTRCRRFEVYDGKVIIETDSPSDLPKIYVNGKLMKVNEVKSTIEPPKAKPDWFLVLFLVVCAWSFLVAIGVL